MTVTEEEICGAILALVEQEKTVAEGAGAVALAAILSGKLTISGARVAAIVSGGNIDVNILSQVIERGLTRDGRTVRLAVLVPDRPGSLSRAATTAPTRRLHERPDRCTALGIGATVFFGDADCGGTHQMPGTANASGDCPVCTRRSRASRRGGTQWRPLDSSLPDTGRDPEVMMWRRRMLGLVVYSRPNTLMPPDQIAVDVTRDGMAVRGTPVKATQ